MVVPKELRAVIFDFDGVIVDSEPLHFRWFRSLLAEEGVILTWEDYNTIYLGMDDRECFSEALTRNGRADAVTKVPELIRRKSALLMEEVAQTPPVLPGAVDCVRALAERVPLAICSGALRREIETMLECAGIRASFLGIVSAEDVTHGKPNPEGYSKALNMINGMRLTTDAIAPRSCLVVEDSLAGIQAAKEAGMRCLAVTNSYSEDELVRGRADAVVTTLAQDLSDVLARSMSS